MSSESKTITQFKAVDDDTTEADAKATASMMLRERFRAEGYVIDSDPEPTEFEAVVLNEEGTGWTPHNGAGKPDGWVRYWTATGHPAATDPAPLEGHAVRDGSGALLLYEARVDDETASTGGAVRVRHGFGGEVTVTAHNDAGQTGYLFATPVTDDEVHVELMAGTTTVRVVKDAES